jgi:four helix bundle protein
VKVQDFKELVVWQKAKLPAVGVYRLTDGFPKSEQFGLTSQIRRAAISIASNIAEGYARQHTREYVQFLYTALASAAELETQLMIAKEIGYLKTADHDTIIIEIKEVQRMLGGLLNALKAKAKGAL